MIDNSIAPVIRMLDWLVVLIIAMVPIANIIVMFVWAFGNTDNPNRRNFAKAFLILMGIWILFSAIFIGQFTGMIVRTLNTFG
ncbi:MAG: hypothetical protein CVU50_07180 [Candidatus Cloacimonetes bacterium HGW-Cloacimonetes-3]|nr:MAG: hypothetical protein CVU50_07180 [Candidatus Cloacimonetes bacterium HGW-Cloacimonetes-3]